MDNQNLTDFFNYVQPIVSGSLGFIKTEGYMTHFPGVIVAMSADETYCAIIHIPVIFNVYMTSIIGTFLQLKDPEVQKLENTYFVGNNIKNSTMMRYFFEYDNLGSTGVPIYTEPDCYQIPDFDKCIGSSDISNIRVSDGRNYYIIPASRSITQVSKADTVDVKIYNNPRSNIIKTVRYTVYKKKFKLPVDIYSNIIMV